MTDKNIINIISKTYFAIVSFLSLIALFLIVLFIVLQHGLYLDTISISNINAKKVYIKWNEKLNLSIQTIEIKKSKKKKNKSAFKIKNINNYLKFFSQTSTLFEKININKIILQDRGVASFNFSEKSAGYLKLNSKELSLESQLIFQNEYLLCKINKLQQHKKSIVANGLVIIDSKKMQIYSQLNLNIHKDANVTLYLNSDIQRVKYKAISHKNIQDITHIITMLDIPEGVKYWVYDAIDMKEVALQEVSGFIGFNDLDNAYKNAHIKATIYDLNYTYNKKVDAIHSKYTELELKDGVLYILPKEAYSYGMYLNKSWLKIDFTKPQELLSLYLLFDGAVNKDMLKILNAYKIKLPFLQKSGSIKTDLTITVNLRTIDVQAHGKFFTKKANFDYLGLNIDIYNAHIQLDNYDVTISKMGASYKEIARALVDVTFNAKTSTGNIRFNVEDIAYKPATLRLASENLKVLYRISPNGDKIYVDSSVWNIHNKIVNLQKMVLPFNMNETSIIIPTTLFSIDTISKGYITGALNIKNKSLDLDADILKFSYDGVTFSQSNTPLHISYKNSLKISSENEIFFNVAGSRYKLKNLHVNFEDNKITLGRTKLFISNYIQTKLNAYYDKKRKRAHISLNNFLLKDSKTDATLYYNKKIMLSILLQDDNIKIESKALNADFISNEKGWFLNIDSLDRVAKNSKLLKKYKLTDGEVQFYKLSNDKYTRFKANINYAYHLLTNQDKGISKYTIKGKITKTQKIYLSINKKINVRIDDDIRINMKNSGINLDEVIRLVKNITKDSKSSKSNIKFDFNAVDSYIYLGKNRYVLSDTIHLQYYDKILTAQLKHAQGNAGVKFENGTFHLYGKNFNDRFMSKLLSLAKFKNGSLEFSMSGKIDEYDGIFFIHKSTILDYKLLNNVLAFVNTIPSLITFSFPSYNSEGLYLKRGYMKFHSKNDFFNISDIYLESPELTILGKGTADLNTNKIDVLLNLKTDLGSDLAKIPLVGYILLDGNSISTTLKIKDKLSDPTVELLLARDIAVAPINIITRTLTLPYKLLNDLLSDTNETEETKK
ncbi:YhdP family protein [Sulfurimonas sp.]